MSRPIAKRSTLLLAAAAALIVAAFAAVPAAQASTLYACVTKRGAAHLYTKKPKKCKSKKEKLVSWNTVGPAGVNGGSGASGVNGSPGANGAVAGYSVAGSGAVDILGGKIEEPVTVLTKKLPAGSYIVFAKTTVSTADTANGAKWLAQCSLSDQPTSGAATFDSSNAFGEVMTNFLFHSGAETVPLGMAISTTSASTLTLGCTNVWNTESTGKFTMAATNSLITAIQTSSNS